MISIKNILLVFVVIVACLVILTFTNCNYSHDNCETTGCPSNEICKDGVCVPGRKTCAEGRRCPPGEMCYPNGKCGLVNCSLTWDGGCYKGSKGFELYEGAWPSNQYNNSNTLTDPEGYGVNTLDTIFGISISECEKKCSESTSCSSYSYDKTANSCMMWPPPVTANLLIYNSNVGKDEMVYGVRPSKNPIILPSDSPCPIAVTTIDENGKEKVNNYYPQPVALQKTGSPPGCWYGDEEILGDKYLVYTKMAFTGGVEGESLGPNFSISECAQKCSDDPKCSYWAISSGSTDGSGETANGGWCQLYNSTAVPVSQVSHGSHVGYSGVKS